jgi:hypothetical protein
MAELFKLLCSGLIGLFRSRTSLKAENVALRHQLNVLRRQAPKRPAFSALDRLIFLNLYQIAPGVIGALRIAQPETVIRWHRAGFRRQACPGAPWVIAKWLLTAIQIPWGGG